MIYKLSLYGIALIATLPTVSHAGVYSYEPLVGIPGVSNGPASLDEWVNAIFILSIALAAMLAVIKLIIAGVKYMLDDIVTNKEDAKRDIWGALLGLLLIMSTVLILSTINTNITNFSIANSNPSVNLNAVQSSIQNSGTQCYTGVQSQQPGPCGQVATMVSCASASSNCQGTFSVQPSGNACAAVNTFTCTTNTNTNTNTNTTFTNVLCDPTDSQPATSNTPNCSAQQTLCASGNGTYQEVPGINPAVAFATCS